MSLQRNATNITKESRDLFRDSLSYKTFENKQHFVFTKESNLPTASANWYSGSNSLLVFGAEIIADYYFLKFEGTKPDAPNDTNAAYLYEYESKLANPLEGYGGVD